MNKLQSCEFLSYTHSKSAEIVFSAYVVSLHLPAD